MNVRGSCFQRYREKPQENPCGSPRTTRRGVRAVNFGKPDTSGCCCDATQRTERNGYRRRMSVLTITWKTKMSDNKVVPFRRREAKPTEIEIEMYRRMTRNWSDEMRQLMFPTLAKLDSGSAQREME